MRVWIVNHYAQMPSEAGQTRHYAFARWLVEHGHEAVVVTADIDRFTRQSSLRPEEDTRTEVVEGVVFIRLRTPSYEGNGTARVSNMIAFARQVRRSPLLSGLPRPDVIVGTSPHPLQAWAGARRARDFHIPFVFEVRDLWPQTLIDSGRFSAHHPAMLGLSWLEKYLCRHARRIITPLPAADDYIVACCGVPRERVVWIPNGVDLSLAPEPAPVAERDCLQVVYAGAHGEANGLGTVLETARLLREQGWEHRFLFRLLGDGQEKLGLQRLAEEWDLSNVVFEHPVPKVEIPDLLSGADIGLLHLRNFPTFMWGISPNKLFDYMAAARPVVCAVTTKDDPVSLAQAGLTVDSEDPAALAAALQRLADLSPQERWEMGLRGRRYVEEHHSFATLSRQFEELLLEVVAEAS